MVQLPGESPWLFRANRARACPEAETRAPALEQPSSTTSVFPRVSWGQVLLLLFVVELVLFCGFFSFLFCR